MRIDWRAGAAVLGVAVLSGCPAEKPPTVDAGLREIDAGVVAERVDAGPPPLLRLEFIVTAKMDGGEAALEFVDGVAELDSTSGLALTTPVRLHDYRVRLFDWADQAVASDDTAELSDAGLAYRIELAEPLKTGRRYTLVVDAELAPEIGDEAGRHYDDVRLGLKVRGQLVPDPPPKNKPGKKKKKE
ncbi:MAG: hypothetical protein AB1730_02575 [Myxococcota bacterium]|jgi:hypothetical protein